MSLFNPRKGLMNFFQSPPPVAKEFLDLAAEESSEISLFPKFHSRTECACEKKR
jgi:hypothetical protein